VSKETIAIIDYGSGNLHSAVKAFEYVLDQENLDAKVLLTNNANEVEQADRIVLPGQGAFGDCYKGLSSIEGMIDALQKSVIERKKPFLGICVGMQLLATKGLEYGEHAGLNWIPGEVIPMAPKDKFLKIPHMGWNEISCTESGKSHPVLKDIVQSTTENDGKNVPHFYFVHSYMFECKDKDHLLSYANYGGPVTAIIGRDNIIGVQFHPEKSQQTGIRLISNFLSWVP